MSYFFQNDSCSRFKAINTLKSSKKRYNQLYVPQIVDLAFIHHSEANSIGIVQRRCRLKNRSGNTKGKRSRTTYLNKYPVNRVKCEKVKAKCSFSMAHRDLHKLRPSKEYIDVFIYPSLMIQNLIVKEIIQYLMQGMVAKSAPNQ